MRRLVERQLTEFKRRFAAVDLKRARSKNLTPYDVLIIASMVEREAQVPRERRLIASVIYNRLHEGIPLGIDATLRYETGNWTRPLRVSQLEARTPYNTRVNAGLPPGPDRQPRHRLDPRGRQPAPHALPLLRGQAQHVRGARVRGHRRGARAERRSLRPGPRAPRRTRAHEVLMRLAGVLGYPVGHSRSPVMMSAAFRELGLDWRYVKLPVPPALFEETVRALPASGYAGANVTIPHKLAARALADEVSPAVAAIGAANTLTFADGRIRADNTDAGRADRRARAAGRGAAGAGARGGGRRSRLRVGAARGRRGGLGVEPDFRARRGAGAELGVGHAERPGPTDLLVNATSVGLQPGMPEEEALAALQLGGSSPPATVVDLVYGDEPTPLWRWASRGHGRVIGGLEVLVRQGALSFELWTGQPAPIEAMRHAV